MRQRFECAKAFVLAGCACAGRSSAAAQRSLYDFTAPQFEKERSLADYRGQVVVVMNIASE